MKTKKRKRKPIERKFGVDFDSSGGALTLRPDDLGTHKSGWTVTGHIQEDYYEWVNEFDATHPKFGRVWGNFEGTVFADSVRGFNDFYRNHPPSPWDYGDI